VEFLLQPKLRHIISKSLISDTYWMKRKAMRCDLPCGTQLWLHVSQYRMFILPGVKHSQEQLGTVHRMACNITGTSFYSGCSSVFGLYF